MAIDLDELRELLTVHDVAAVLKVSKNRVYEHTRSGRRPRAEQLPHMKLGKYVRDCGAAIGPHQGSALRSRPLARLRP